jgi:hypothetical protein
LLFVCICTGATVRCMPIPIDGLLLIAIG